MPYNIKTDDENRVIIIKTNSDTKVEDIIAFISELMEEPYLSLQYGILIDFRDASLAGVFGEDVKDIYQFLKVEKEKVQSFHLSVLTSRQLEYGLNRMFEELSDEPDLPFKMLVTYDEKEAWQWVKHSPAK